MTVLYLDFETFSEADIRKVGAQAYARHPSTEALMLGWAIDDQRVDVWDIAAGRSMPLSLGMYLSDPRVLISAFNAQFERLILQHCMGVKIPASRFRCTMVRGFGMAFNGSMDSMAEQFNLGIAKDPRGRALIQKFSKLQPENRKVSRWDEQNAPEEWAEFKSYCKKDVEVERMLAKKLAPYYFPEIEWERYALDQEINDRGVPLDLVLINTAIGISKLENGNLLGQMRELTDLANPNSRNQLIGWLEENGCLLPNLQKDTIANYIEREADDPKILEVLKLKQQLAKTSVTKWAAFKRVSEGDGVARGMFQFGGASRTMRAAGRLVQLQNLARGGNTTYDPSTAAEIMMAGGWKAAKTLYGNPMGLLSDTIRSAIKAPEGEVLNVSDLHSIESVVLGWVSDCRVINECFAAGRDTYKTLAVDMFKVPYSEVTKPMRTFCKPPVLGGGYMLGWKGLIAYADGMGVTMTKEEAEKAIKILRDSWPEVVEFWDWCKKAVFHTTQTGQEYPGAHGLKTFAHGEFLLIRLPSGRNLAYHLPRIELRMAPWGQMIDTFTYMGTNRHKGNKWERISAHAGGITENVVQAIARDVLYTWADRAKAADFHIVLHVHDEIGTVEKTDRLTELNSLLDEPIPWAPGLKVGADGYVAERYKKD